MSDNKKPEFPTLESAWETYRASLTTTTGDPVPSEQMEAMRIVFLSGASALFMVMGRHDPWETDAEGKQIADRIADEIHRFKREIDAYWETRQH